MNRLKNRLRIKGRKIASELPSYLQVWRLPPLKRIGPEQFADLFRITPIATLGQIVNATIVAIALIGPAGVLPVLGWWIANFLMCGWTFYRWLNNRHRKVEKLSRRAIPRAVVSGILYALPWAMLAGLYLGSLPRHQELIMSIAIIGMVASGSVQLSRIYPAAIAYLMTILITVIIKCIWIGEAQYYLLAGLSVSYIAYLLTIVANSANASIERSTALKELETKVGQLDEANDALEQLASFDDLTQLPNRRTFYTHLESIITEASLLGDQFYVLVGDLDHFKNVNDMAGHAAGDQLLREVAYRLAEGVDEADLVARMGGDEFAVITQNSDIVNDRNEFMEQLLARINEPVDLDGTAINPGMSFGISTFPNDARDTESLLTYADLALQQGKSLSRGAYWFFDKDMSKQLAADNVLERELRAALTAKEFELFYQPKVDIKSGRLHGMESLVRWRRGKDEVVAPGAFFRVAEERGLMSELADYVLHQFIEDNCHWQRLGLDAGQVSVNIHPIQIKDRNRMASFADQVAATSLDINKLVLEITEECVVGRGTDEVPDTLAFMRDRNFRISLDDFGTGYASLTHLKTLPVDELKIDRSFISDLNSDLSDRAIVLAMIKLAESLGLSVVAEGIEDQEQHNTLLAMGCRTGQGYFYGRPMDLDSATACLREEHALKVAEETPTASQMTQSSKRSLSA